MSTMQITLSALAALVCFYLGCRYREWQILDDLREEALRQIADEQYEADMLRRDLRRMKEQTCER